MKKIKNIILTIMLLSPTLVFAETDCGAFSDMFNTAYKIVLIAAPIILLVMSGVDFLKATMGDYNGKGDPMKEAFNNLKTRCIICAAIILLKLIVNAIISLTTYGDLTSCGL